ncbi:transcriptional regulator, IclR family [Tranquillimonas rosea]|uniref:Transcriptional regulator, IclR family n=1 Tax=Tranquillimonas rosea TaxID=641238 RepID=A0A1H9WTZ2_9RHOB|nr:IclR family transcriptional regulator [Tranquillimonas rosea]SES37420.1 transcriptional regulator, IclR family [Tranquillimonas rosea]
MAGETVQSVARALTLLRLLAHSGDGARVSDLARDCGLAISTTHRLLTTLQAEGFALCDPTSGLWHVGQEAHSTGLAFGRRHSLAGPALPHLRQLRDATRETANVGVMRDGWLVNVGQVESREIMRAIAAPGARVPATSSGMGKAILSTWPDDAIEAHVARHGLPRLTGQSRLRLRDLMDDLHRARTQGWALDDEEHARGLRCIAAPVLGQAGEAVGALSISGLTQRLPDARIPTVGADVRQAARDLGERLSGT